MMLIRLLKIWVTCVSEIMIYTSLKYWNDITLQLSNPVLGDDAKKLIDVVILIQMWQLIL